MDGVSKEEDEESGIRERKRKKYGWREHGGGRCKDLEGSVQGAEEKGVPSVLRLRIACNDVRRSDLLELKYKGNCLFGHGKFIGNEG